jgi:hypothetical protein
MQKYFLAIDDTDNLESKGTGFRAREICTGLIENKLADVSCATRHQLYVHKDIPYTSHNSSASLVIFTEKYNEVLAFARDYLLKNAAEGSDAGLCIAHENQVTDEIINWGRRAKIEILKKDEAYFLAKNNNIFLEGLTGTKDGVIGSLAAIGLRKEGNDGRLIWTKGKELREIRGKLTCEELLQITNFDIITDKYFVELEKNILIDTGDWIRPIMHNNKITLIVEQKNNNENEWQIASKDYIKSITN